MTQRNFLTAAAVGLVLACGSGPSHAQVKSTNAVTTPSFTQDIRGGLPTGDITAGATSRGFGAAAYNSAGANGSDGPMAVGANDVMFKTNWYFRVGGGTSESRFAAPDTATLTGDTAVLSYGSLAAGAFSAELTVTVAEPAAGQGTQYSSMSITNPGATPLTIDLFNYTDADAAGSFSGDSAVDLSADGNIVIEVTDGADTVQVGGEGATAFQVIEWDADAAALPQTLESTDAAITNLDDSGLPFGPGDFTSAVQWAGLTVPAGGTITVRHGIANNIDLVFGGGGGNEPEIEVAPAALSFAAEVDATDSDDLSITNIGEGTLTWSIDTAVPAVGWAGSIATAGTDVLARSGGGNAVASTGDPVVVGDTQMSQTTDTTIAPANSAACPSGESRAFRRFYFDEHPGVANPAGITSVDVALQEAAESTSLTVNLYTLPASTPVDTIPLDSLTLIGTASVPISVANDGTIINVPVTGNVADTSASNLVVEVASTVRYFIGASNGGQTHPGFLMAPGCGATAPTPIDTLGPDFVDTHIIIVVNAAGGGPGPVGCDNPSTIPWLDIGTASGSAEAGETDLSTITADATGMAAGTYDALLCVASNDSVGNELVEVPVEFIVTGGDDDTIFANGFESDAPGECEPLQLLADPGLEATGGDAGANPNWSGTDTGGAGTPFYGAAARTGSFGAWGGGWTAATTQTWTQSVTIPSGNPRFLNFWRQVSLLPGSGSAVLTASIDGTEVFTFTGGSADADFVSESVDVSAFADGGDHDVEFAVSDPGGGNLFVDDITLECQGPVAATVPVRAPMPGASKHDATQR